MNNVEQRAFAPKIKRRKVETDENIGLARTFGNGSGGDIGQYVKEKQQQGTNQPRLMKRVEAVDLTDTGELHSQANRIICLTTLQRKKTMLSYCRLQEMKRFVMA